MIGAVAAVVVTCGLVGVLRAVTIARTGGRGPGAARFTRSYVTRASAR
jgi:hypothetical protein